MNPETKTPPPNPYVLVALCSGGASVCIAAISANVFTHINTGSDSSTWAIALMLAVMVAAPAVMGIGVAYFMSKQR